MGKKKSISKKNGITRILKKQMKMKTKQNQKNKNKFKNEEILNKLKKVNNQVVHGAVAKSEKKVMKLNQSQKFVSKMEVADLTEVLTKSM